MTNTFVSQWMPILLSSVAVFIVSSLIHMIVRWHRNDQAALPNEAAVADLLRSVPAGDYRLPFAATQEEMRGEDFKARIAKGPMAHVVIMAGDFASSFKRALIQWFVYSIIVSALAGHVAGTVLAPDADHALILHTVGITAFLGYGMAIAQQPIWGGKPWIPAIKAMVDALVYASVTAAIFLWLWK